MRQGLDVHRVAEVRSFLGWDTVSPFICRGCIGFPKRQREAALECILSCISQNEERVLECVCLFHPEVSLRLVSEAQLTDVMPFVAPKGRQQ